MLKSPRVRGDFIGGSFGDDLGDPVKVFSIYGLDPCGKNAIMMGGLRKQVGLKGGSRATRITR